MTRWGEIKCPKCEALEAENTTLKQMWWDAGDVTDLAGTIAELEAKLAKAVAELRKLGEAGRAHGYGSSYIICHNCSDTHHAVDAILAELKGQGDE